MTLSVFLSFLLAQAACYRFSHPSKAHIGSSRSLSALSMRVEGNVLVVQNNGGGHGEIGFHLCQQLKSENPGLKKLVLLQDECNRDKPPFNSYAELENSGVEIVHKKLTDYVSSAIDASGITGHDVFDYVVDNWSKDEDMATMVVSLSQQVKAKQLVFVSSAGIYESTPIMPLLEGDAVEEGKAARMIEKVMASSGVSYTFLRPQYIYGPKANKRYLDYFFARASRNMPIPLPLNGNQLVCISHVEDVAALVAQVIAAPQAMNQIFNCATDKLVSYNDLAEHCHHALGHTEREDVKIAYYEPKHFEHWKGSGLQQFPFRRETFVVGVDKARLAFPDWQPKHELAEDMRELAEAYCSSAAAQEDLSMDDLRYDFELAASKDIDFMFEYPFFDDLEINSAQ